MQIEGIDTVIDRPDWEQRGFEINNSWYTPPRQNWSRIQFPMAHYTAASNLPDGDIGESPEDLVRYIQNMQRWYLDHYKFSVGYLYGVDWLGRAIVFRGDEYRAAANNGDKGQWKDINLNNITAPVLFLVDGQDRLTPAMAKTGRMLYRHMHRKTLEAGGQWTQTSPKPHSETDYTSCCGDGIRRDIAEGILDINYKEWVPMPPPAPPKEKAEMSMMFMKHPKQPHLFVVTDVHHVTGVERDRLIALGVTERLDDLTDAQFAAFKRQAAENQ